MTKQSSLFITTLCIAIAFLLIGCKTTQPSLPQTPATPTQDSTTPTIIVEPNPELISIQEAIQFFENPEDVPFFVKKYAYKVTNNYQIYRLDNFTKMYYKNCKPANLLTKTHYEDYPKPLKKGISSYIALKEGAIIIGVFNQKVYDNLLEQVKSAGFVLDMPGNEDIYVKGKRTIACYHAAKTIRIQ